MIVFKIWFVNKQVWAGVFACETISHTSNQQWPLNGKIFMMMPDKSKTNLDFSKNKLKLV